MMIFALSFLVFACANARPIAPPRCSTGSAYEVLAYDAGRSFHSIMGSRAGVADAAACAGLCAKATGCTCAFYGKDKTCSWRTSPCDTSEMFVDAKPRSRRHGLIRVCPAKPLKTYARCGTGSACCSPCDVCIEKNEWYSQCLRRGTKVGADWTGRVKACRAH